MTLSVNASGGMDSYWFFVLRHSLSQQLWTVLSCSTEMDTSSRVSSAENGGEIARVWYSSVKALLHVSMKRKKASRQKQFVPKKGPSQNLSASQKRMLWCFSSVEKGEVFPSAFYDSLKTTGIFGGQFEGSLWVEMKFIQREKLCFRKGSTLLSSMQCLPKDISQGWIVGTVSPCRYWPAAPFAHPDSRAEQRQCVCFVLGWLICPWQLLLE